MPECTRTVFADLSRKFLNLYTCVAALSPGLDAIARQFAGQEIDMQQFSTSTFGDRKFPDRKPVWTLFTGLAICVIGMVTVFGITDVLTMHPTQFSSAVDFLAPSNSPPQQLW